MDTFSQGCKDFGLSISLKKTDMLRQDVDISPVITVNNYELDVIDQFTYIRATISHFLSLNTEISV